MRRVLCRRSPEKPEDPLIAGASGTKFASVAAVTPLEVETGRTRQRILRFPDPSELAFALATGTWSTVPPRRTNRAPTP